MVVESSAYSLGQVDTERIVRIQRARDAINDLREVSVDAPIAGFVGVGQSGACHVAAETPGDRASGIDCRHVSMSRRLSR